MGASVTFLDTADMGDVEYRYDGRVPVVLELVVTLVFLGAAATAAVDGDAFAAVLTLAGFGLGVWDAVWRRGWLVELATEGDLIVTKLSGPRQVPVHTVRTIRRRSGGEGGSTFTIAYDGGSVTLGTGARAQALVDELVRCNPDIAVRGHRVP